MKRSKHFPAIAAARGWPVAEEICDPGESASNLNRPGMQAVMERLRGGEVAGVIAWRLDRLTRSVRDLLELLDLTSKAKVDLVSVTESLDTTNPMGRFVVHLLGMIAQLERETIAARTKSAMAYAKSKGFYSGGRPPVGTQVVADGERKRLVAGPDADRVRPVWSLILDGGSLRDAAAYLRRSGLPGTWTPQTARNLLLSPLLTGLLVEPIMQERVRHTLATKATPMRNGKHTTPRPAETPSPLRSIIRCPACNAAMVQVTARGNGGKYRYLRCTSRIKDHCLQRDLRAEPIEAAVMEAVADACQPGGPYRALLEADFEARRGTIEQDRAERAQLTAEHDQIAARVADLTLNHQIGTPSWNMAMKSINTRLEFIEPRLAVLAGRIASAESDRLSTDLILNDLWDRLQTLAQATVEEQTQLLTCLVQSARIEGDSVALTLYQPAPAAKAEGGPGSLKAQITFPRMDGIRTVVCLVPLRRALAIRL